MSYDWACRCVPCPQFCLNCGGKQWPPSELTLTICNDLSYTLDYHYDGPPNMLNQSPDVLCPGSSGCWWGKVVWEDRLPGYREILACFCDLGDGWFRFRVFVYDDEEMGFDQIYEWQSEPFQKPIDCYDLCLKLIMFDRRLNKCTYEWDGSQWNLQNDGCIQFFSCDPGCPYRDGEYVGEIIECECVFADYAMIYTPGESCPCPSITTTTGAP